MQSSSLFKRGTLIIFSKSEIAQNLLRIFSEICKVLHTSTVACVIFSRPLMLNTPRQVTAWGLLASITRVGEARQFFVEAGGLGDMEGVLVRVRVRYNNVDITYKDLLGALDSVRVSFA